MSIVNMSFSDYLSNPAYGASDLNAMSRSFSYYEWKKAQKQVKTRPLVIGSVTHALLEDEIINSEGSPPILIYDDGSSLTNGFKAFQEANPDSYCVDKKEYELCKKMVAALIAEPEVMSYLDGAITEPTLIAKFPHTEVTCKVRPDYLHLGKGVSINLKTAADASESAFLYSARDYGYDWQSSLYCLLLSEEYKKPFDEVHIVVEKTDGDEPPPINIFSFGDDTLAFARSQLWEIMQKIPECEKTGIWPKNKSFLQTVEMPMHMRKVVHL